MDTSSVVLGGVEGKEEKWEKWGEEGILFYRECQ